MKKILSNLILCLLVTYHVSAQRTLTGRISSDSEPGGLPGVTVKVSGSNTQSTSDSNGNYSISIPEDGGLVLFALTGYRSQEIEVSFQETLDILMIQSQTSDNQISVGYGSVSKDEMTSTISQIDAESIGGQPLIDLEQANQGRASGVFIQNNGGKLGQGTTVKIRGGSSLTGSNEPLYVVDGIPLSSDNQSEINPNNIASMEVLKDASAAAIYGSRAANGVILITTKKGQSGKIQVDLDYQLGMGRTPKELDLMTPTEFNEMFMEYTLRIGGFDEAITRQRLKEWAEAGTATFTLNGTDYSITPSALDSLDGNTDWQDEVFQTAISHRANVNVSGGNENHRFFSGLGYTTQEGILIGNDYSRFNVDLNVNSEFTEKLTTTVGLSFVHSENNKLPEDQDLGSPLQAIVLPPSDRFREENNYQLDVFKLNYNPLTEINFMDFLETNDRFIGNLGARYKLNDNLTLNVDGGIDFLDFREERRQGPETLDGNPTGFSRLSESDVFNYIVNGYLNYSTQIGDNSLSAVVGASYQESNIDFTFRSARVNSISELENKTENDADLFEVPIPSSASVFLSYFTRINYSVQQKYNFQLSARMDGSSKFGEDNRYGLFPAVSAGWTISNEPFLNGNSSINFLKLKGSYGLVGNTPDDDFIYRTNYFNILYGNEQGIRLSNLSNPDLKWETTAQFDIGLEFGLFSDILSGSINYYQKNITDLLFPVPVSQTSGFDFVLQNVGAMENSGLEVELSGLIIDNENVTWSASANFSTFNSEITDLGSENRRLISGVNAFIEGESPGVFFMPVYVGPNSADGSAEWENGLGGTTTSYDDALLTGRQVVGDPNPDFFGGFSNTLSAYGFELSFLLQFVQGVDKYNQTGEFLANSGILLLGQRGDQVNRWIEPGDEVPFSVIEPSLENTNPSTRWLEDGSFIRLNTLTLGYNLPIDLIQNWGMRYFKIYIGGQNLFTISDYSGYDPDTNYLDPNGGTITSNINRGIDDFTTPQPRVFTTGIKIGF